MATLSLFVKDVNLTTVLNFFTIQLQAPYSPFLPDGITPNPLSLQQHVEQRLEDHYEAMYDRFVKNGAVAAYEGTLPFNDAFGV